MKNQKHPQASSIKEILGFGLGCLLGGLAGAATGLLFRAEAAVATSYVIGFTGGGFLGTLVTRRLVR